MVRNRLETGDDGRLRAVATDQRETIPCDVVLDVGYLGTGLDGVPFDERRGVIPNDGGRALGADGSPVPGVYVAGSIKRGPSGVIGTNKKDATETVDLLLADAAEGRGAAGSPPLWMTSTHCSPRVVWRSSRTRAGSASTRSSAPRASRRAVRA